MASKLLDRTRELLGERSSNEMAKISVETGLPLSWLLSVKYKDNTPAVDRIETLYEYLSGHVLEVK